MARHRQAVAPPEEQVVDISILIEALSLQGGKARCTYDTGRYAEFIRARTMGRVQELCLKSQVESAE